MIEIMAKDEDKRLAFDENKYVLKADRNPVAGEMTARDNAPYLVAFDTAKMADDEFNKRPVEKSSNVINKICDESRMKGSTATLQVVREVERCQTLRERRDLIESEMNMMNEILEHKRVCTMGGFTGTGQTQLQFGGKKITRRPF
jgi:hypothetical protein